VRPYFKGGYRCNYSLYLMESIITIMMMLWRGMLPWPITVAFAAFVLLSAVVLYRGKLKKKLLSETAHMRLQSIAFIIVNVFLSCAINSAQSFIYAMCFSSVVNFVFIDVKQMRYQIYVSVLASLAVACYAGFYTQSSQTMLVYTFGWLTLTIQNIVLFSMTNVITHHMRQNREQELSLDDLLKVVEAKCDEAQAATRSKTRFLANMSHEIRTPINSVIGMNEMVLRESTEENILDYAGEAKTAAESLLGIINDILDITKIEEGRLNFVEVKYDLAQIIGDVHNLIKFRAKAKDLQFNVIVDRYLPRTLLGDDIRLKQILLNLLTNAVKYTHKGTITLEVKYFGSEQIAFSVRDTGIGIKEEDIGRLFDAFKRVEETRNRSIEGTGLGLNITATLLKMLGSELKVSSVYGKGSEFSFVLKQQVVDHTPIGEINLNIRQNTRKNYEVSFKAPDAKLLVVDDNEMNRKVIRQLLKNTLVKVSEAASGFECLEMTANERYDLIFMDHMMPELDGIETFHKLRDDKSNLCCDTPVVILTANAVIGAEKKYLEEGFDGFLSKPVKPENLEEVVRAKLDESLIKQLSELPDDTTSDDAKAEAVEFPVIEGVDWSYGRAHIGDDDALLETTKMFCSAIKRDMDELDGYFTYIDEESSCDSYRVKVHSMKSSAALIGIISLTGMAMELEHAARTQDRETIKALHPVYRQRWLSFSEPLGAMFESNEPKKDAAENAAEISEIFEQIRAAAEEMDVDKLDELSAKLDGYSFSDERSAKIEEVKGYILNFEIEKLMEVTI